MPKRQFHYRVVYSDEPMSEASLRRAGELLARMVARAYLVEHYPELLTSGPGRPVPDTVSQSTVATGPPAAEGQEEPACVSDRSAWARGERLDAK